MSAESATPHSTIGPRGGNSAAVPELVVLIGCPGAGKSTWCRTQADTVHSIDAARAELGTGEADQTVTPAAVALTVARVDHALARPGRVLVDATGATADQRATWTRLGREHHAALVAVVFMTPLALCLTRNRVRSRHVPEDVLMIMWHAIAELTDAELTDEGFSTIHRITTDSQNRPD